MVGLPVDLLAELRLAVIVIVFENRASDNPGRAQARTPGGTVLDSSVLPRKMTNMERLNKFLAHAGVGSRRHCETLIATGRVSVDGKTVRELGTKVNPDQRVAVDGQPIRAERFVYWLVNKPRGYLCTNHDPAGRPLAIDLVPQVSQRVYTVGRLDESSEGLLLLTNDGDLANGLMHPRFGVEKTYLVQVAGNPDRDDLLQLLKGVWLSDGHVRARQVKRLKTHGESTSLRIVLSEGKNREIRRMLARLGHKVLRLKRTAIGPVRIGNLGGGKARRLTAAEVAELRQATQRRRKGRERTEP
jgi:23S rRNA pseudouridine2605 synthase